MVMVICDRPGCKDYLITQQPKSPAQINVFKVSIQILIKTTNRQKDLAIYEHGAAAGKGSTLFLVVEPFVVTRTIRFAQSVAIEIDSSTDKVYASAIPTEDF